MVIEKFSSFEANLSKSNQYEDLEDIGEVKENGIGKAYFSDDEDFVDEIDDEELLGDLITNKPLPPEKFDNVVIIDNTPIVGSDRLDKLKNHFRKLLSPLGEITNEFYPQSDDGMTKGYIFIEFSSKDSAYKAVAKFNGHHIDKSHTLVVNHIGDVDKFEKCEERTTPILPSTYKEIGNLYEWVLHPEGYDQFLVLSQPDHYLSIYLNIPTGPELIEQKEKWTEKQAVWSPKGTYLATYHDKGVALWGTQKFEKIKSYIHPKVEFFEFSPCEKYLVTFSSKMASIGEPIIIWEVISGVQKRIFQYNSFLIHGHPIWPPFKWSHDGSFFARISAMDTLSIYDSQTFALLDKTHTKIKNLVNFEWSPAENVMAYWVSEDKDIPAKVFIVAIPSKRELRPPSNLGATIDCKIVWHKQGNYLALKVDRYAKKKADKDGLRYQGISHIFEIFHMRESEIPKDSIEFKSKILDFDWEPNGNKFAIISEHQVSTTLSLYEINKGGKPPNLIKEIAGKKCNKIFWCPTGQILVTAEIHAKASRSDIKSYEKVRSSTDNESSRIYDKTHPLKVDTLARRTDYLFILHPYKFFIERHPFLPILEAGALEFIDTRDMIRLGEALHNYLDFVEWDPTGRFIATAVTYVKSRKDNDFRIWTFQGKLLSKKSVPHLLEFKWRPRLPALLKEDKVKEIKKNLKKYSTNFDILDKMMLSLASKELMDKRKREREAFAEYQLTKSDKAKRIKEAKDTLLAEANINFADLEEETFELFQSEEKIPIK